MSRPSVSLITVLHNSLPQLEGWARTILDQKLVPDQILLVDNASNDGTVAEAQKLLPRSHVLNNEVNLGFGAACNQALACAQGEFVFLLNPDARLDPEYLERLLQAMLQRETCAAACGKLIDGQGSIESAGQILQRNRQVHNRGAGQRDSAVFGEDVSIFGVSAAAALYRRSALEKVSVQGRVFDPCFFLYYEDSDLSWRLRLVGWDCWYIHGAVGIHPTEGALQAWKKIHLRCNRWLMMLKNDAIRDVLRDLYPILRFEAVCWKNTVVRERWAFQSYLRFLKYLPGALVWRRQIQSMSRSSIRPWISSMITY